MNCSRMCASNTSMTSLRMTNMLLKGNLVRFERFGFPRVIQRRDRRVSFADQAADRPKNARQFLRRAGGQEDPQHTGVIEPEIKLVALGILDHQKLAKVSANGL